MSAAGPPDGRADRASIPERFILGGAIAAVVLVVGVIVLSLGSGLACACTPPPPTQGPVPPSPVEGVVVSVDSSGLIAVQAFDLRLADGSTVHLELGSLENAGEFSPSHLSEHMASSERVRAFYRLEGGVPVVYRLEDAAE